MTTPPQQGFAVAGTWQISLSDPSRFADGRMGGSCIRS